MEQINRTIQEDDQETDTVKVDNPIKTREGEIQIISTTYPTREEEATVLETENTTEKVHFVEGVRVVNK